MVSICPITSDNFESATRGLIFLVSPPGTPESCRLSGLIPGSDYYFAVKTMDDNGNWSDLSNVVHRSSHEAATAEEAIARLGETVDVRGERGPARAWLFLALAHHHRGQKAEARRCLDVARRLAPGDAEALAWDGRLILRLAGAEVEGLLRTGPP